MPSTRERPLERMRTLEELVSDSTADRRALSALLATGGGRRAADLGDRRLRRHRRDDGGAHARARDSRGDRRRSRAA